MIHDLILQKVQSVLEKALITDIDPDDPARAGTVKIGNLQGDPDPDVARISITIFENDPDTESGKGSAHKMDAWEDEVYEIEIGGYITWKRRFVVHGRCLLEGTRESLSEARAIASTVRSRIESTLLRASFSGVTSNGEYVSRGVIGEDIFGTMTQAGGPPDAYDYFLKVRFEVLTTTGV